MIDVRLRRVIVQVMAACLVSIALAAGALAGVPPAQQTTASDNPGGALQRIPFPNLGGMEPVVQEQLREAQSKLTAVLQRPDATASDKSEAYGQLGRLYHAYDLEDAALSCYLNAERLAPQK